MNPSRRSAPRPSRPAALRRWADCLLGIHGESVPLRFRERAWIDAVIPDDARWTLCRELILLRSYETFGVRLADCTGVVIDAGAHAGLFSLMASHYARRVVALEPHPILHSLLIANAERNRARNEARHHIAVQGDFQSAAQIEAWPRALWPERTSVRFYTAMPNSMLSVARAPGKSACEPAAEAAAPAAAAEIEVETITLAELVAVYGEIDLLKLDVEGAEWEVLMQADASALGRVQRITGELHLHRDEMGRQEQLAAHLRHHGFDVAFTPTRQYRPMLVRRVLQNWARLEGHTLLKAAVLAYCLFPAPKPLLPAGDGVLTPHFFARRVNRDR